ncbi:GNAT family N-acetyltransferase [Kitasatospora sp. NPDC001539]|uniref:GNAT family N-acetyltransferase n=1 Tax=Kitasatospora sp. NPDC001539 TaxID=3154384 RepID=UPI00332E2D25
MNALHSLPGTGHHGTAITRASDTEWHAVEDDRVVGHGDALLRPDGRLFIGIDAWHGAVFDRLAEAMAAALPAPLYAVADEADHDALAAWQRAGFTTVRRERVYAVPTDPEITGLGPARPPAGVDILPVGRADEAPLRDLDRVLHGEIEAGDGWWTMPARLMPCSPGTSVVDPSKYAVARQGGRYVGLLRLAPLTRRPRIGLIAVRSAEQRHGIARALLADTLDALHRSGTTSVRAEVTETNAAATALFEGIGARCDGATLELVRR